MAENPGGYVPEKSLRSIACLCVLGIVGLLLLISGSAALGQPQQTPTAAAVLAKCEQCHGEKLQMAHLSVASRDLILKGGDHGPALIPGNAEGSLIYQRITGQAQPVMPMAPMPRLTADEIAAVKDWIAAGAPMGDESKAASQAADNSLLVFGSYQNQKI